MKRLFLVYSGMAIMMAILTFSLIWCDDDDDNSTSIVGIWKYSNTTMELGKYGSFYSYMLTSKTIFTILL